MITAGAHGSTSRIVRLTEDECRLFHCTAGLRQAPFVDGEFMPASVDRLTKSLHAKVSKLLSNRFKTHANVIELSGHDNTIVGSDDTT